VSSNYTIVGRIGTDPRLSVSDNGVVTVKFSVAVGHRKKKDGEWTEETVWHDLTIFGDQAENAAESFVKGDQIIATGRVEEPRTFEKKDGTTGVALPFIVDDIGPALRFQRAPVQRVERTAAQPSYSQEPF
jgi:single-strand DNA-binding protein